MVVFVLFDHIKEFVMMLVNGWLIRRQIDEITPKAQSEMTDNVKEKEHESPRVAEIK